MKQTKSNIYVALVDLVMPFNFEQILVSYTVLAVIFRIVGAQLSSFLQETATSDICYQPMMKELLMVFMSTVALTGIIYHQTLCFSIFCTYAAFTLHFSILHILLPLLEWIGSFIQNSRFIYRLAESIYDENRIIVTLIQCGFLFMFVMSVFSFLLPPSEMSRYSRVGQAISFFFLTLLFCTLLTVMAFFSSPRIGDNLRESEKKGKPLHYSQNQQMLNRYLQRQLIAIMLVAPLFFVGKIIYSFKLIFDDDGRHLGPIYSERSFELIVFSVQFLGPLLCQLCASFQHLSKKKIVCPPGGNACRFFSFIFVISIFLNFPFCGAYRIIGTIMSVSAMLQTTRMF